MEMETVDCRPGWEALGGGLWLGRRPTLLLVREDGSGGVSSSHRGNVLGIPVGFFLFLFG